MAAEGEFLSAAKASEFAEAIYGWKVSGQTLKNYMVDGRTPRGRTKPCLSLRSRRIPVNGYMADYRCLDEGTRFQISTTPMIGVAAGVFVWPRSSGPAGA